MNPKQALLDKIVRREAVVAIYGLGYVGLPLALRFVEAGAAIVIWTHHFTPLGAAAPPHPQTPCYHARQDGKMNAATDQNATHHKIVIGDAR